MKAVWLTLWLGCALLQADEGWQELREIEQRLKQEMPMAAAGIEVTRRDDAIVLEGVVASLRAKERAFDAARSVSEQRVRDELRIGDPHLRDGF